MGYRKVRLLSPVAVIEAYFLLEKRCRLWERLTNVSSAGSMSGGECSDLIGWDSAEHTNQEEHFHRPCSWLIGPIIVAAFQLQ